MSVLKVCPFCGSDEIEDEFDAGPAVVPAWCARCGADGPAKGSEPGVDWNTRAPDWQDISTAPQDGTCFLGVVDGSVRLVGFGKTSHLPWRGFCLADQGVEDFDICTPTAWMPLPAPPKEVG